MHKRNRGESGAIILETSIVLPIFMLVVLFIYGFFGIVGAQNQITHALLQSSKSLSLDPYLLENIDSVAKANTFWSSFGDMLLDYSRMSNDEHFSSMGNWYEGPGQASLVEDRFVGYLTGGDKGEAEAKLRGLGVIGGLDGMNFDMEISSEDMTISVEYKLRFLFDAFGMGEIPVEQKITTRLWGVNRDSSSTTNGTGSGAGAFGAGSGGGGIRS